MIEVKHAGIYLLRVTEVDARSLAEPQTLEFEAAPGFDRLPKDHFELYEWKMSLHATSLSGEQVKEIEQSNVGAERRLLVYETGAFLGRPNTLPVDVVQWPGTAFSFQTSLVVTADR